MEEIPTSPLQELQEARNFSQLREVLSRNPDLQIGTLDTQAILAILDMIEEVQNQLPVIHHLCTFIINMHQWERLNPGKPITPQNIKQFFLTIDTALRNQLGLPPRPPLPPIPRTYPEGHIPGLDTPGRKP